MYSIGQWQRTLSQIRGGHSGKPEVAEVSGLETDIPRTNLAVDIWSAIECELAYANDKFEFALPKVSGALD
jgi:hypothetical protein